MGVEYSTEDNESVGAQPGMGLQAVAPTKGALWLRLQCKLEAKPHMG